MPANTTRTRAAVPVSTEGTNAEVEHKLKTKQVTDNKNKAKLSLLNSKKIPISISPMYAAQFSDVMTVTINGYSIFVPCDGQTYMISEPFALEILTRIERADEKERVSNRMSNVQNNFEQYAGANSFITKA